MKKIFLILFLSAISSSLIAQKIIDKKLPWSKNQLVNLHLTFADSIRVRYWDKDEVSVKISVDINSGKLNDALLVNTKSTSDEVFLDIDLDKKMLKAGKKEDCPNDKPTNTYDQDGDRVYTCATLHYEVVLPRSAKLKLETINGNIDIQGAETTVFAKTISGWVDMTWPKSKGANLAMQTVTGEVYSDLNIDFKDQKQKNPIVGYMLKGAVNGGGPELHLESISNNVYLRNR